MKQIFAAAFLLCAFALFALSFTSQKASAIVIPGAIDFTITDSFGNNIIPDESSLAILKYSCTGGAEDSIQDNSASDLDQSTGKITFTPQAETNCSNGNKLTVKTTNLGLAGYVDSSVSAVYDANDSNSLTSKNNPALFVYVKSEINEFVKTSGGSVTYSIPGAASYICVQSATTKSTWGCPVPTNAGTGNVTANKSGFAIKEFSNIAHATNSASSASFTTASLNYLIVINSLTDELGNSIAITDAVSAYVNGMQALDVDADGNTNEMLQGGKIYLAYDISQNGNYDVYVNFGGAGYAGPEKKTVAVNRSSSQSLDFTGIKYSLVVTSMKNMAGADVMPISGTPFIAAGTGIARQYYSNGKWHVALKTGSTSIIASTLGYVNRSYVFGNPPFNDFVAGQQKTLGFQDDAGVFDYKAVSFFPNTTIIVQEGAAVAVPDATVSIYTDNGYTSLENDLSKAGASNASRATDNEGRANFALISSLANPETYYLRVAKAGYTTYGTASNPVSFTVNAGVSNFVNVSLQRAAAGIGSPSAAASSFTFTKNQALSDFTDFLTVKITVKDAAGAALQGKTVTMSNSSADQNGTAYYKFDQTSKTTAADGTAAFNIYGLLNGNHTGTVAAFEHGETKTISGGTFVRENTPPAKVSNLGVANVGNGTSLTVSWTNPADPDFKGVIIFRSETLGGAKATAQNNTQTSVIADSRTGQGAISRAPGGAAAYTDTGLTAEKTYFYSLVSADYNNNLQTNNLDEVSGIPTVAGQNNPASGGASNAGETPNAGATQGNAAQGNTQSGAANNAGSTAFQRGDLLKIKCPQTKETEKISANHICKAVYFVGKSGRRHPFPQDRVYFSWYKNFQEIPIKQITEDQMKAIPLGKPMPMRSGSKLIQITGEQAVYAVEIGNVLRQIASETQARALFGTSWTKKVIDLPSSFFAGVYTFGSNLTESEFPAGMIIISADGNYYRITGEKKKQLITAGAIAANRIRNEFIISMQKATTDAIPTSSKTISSADDDLRFAY